MQSHQTKVLVAASLVGLAVLIMSFVVADWRDMPKVNFGDTQRTPCPRPEERDYEARYQAGEIPFWH